MELKYHILSCVPTPFHGSNRTFMELKYVGGLAVPLAVEF